MLSLLPLPFSMLCFLLDAAASAAIIFQRRFSASPPISPLLPLCR